MKYATTKQSGGGSHRLLEAYHFEGGPIGYLPMEQPMVLSQDDSLEHTLDFFIESEVSCVWIVDDVEKMKLVGVLTEEDLRLKMLELM